MTERRMPVVEADERFSAIVLESRREAAQAVGAYLRSEPVLAEFRKEEFGCAILASGRIVYTRDGWEPVGAGLWMDWEEKEWGLSQGQYRALPREKRAALEAQEQVEKWVAKEFYGLWLEMYMPTLADERWWGSWYNLSFEDRAKQAEKLAWEMR